MLGGGSGNHRYTAIWEFLHITHHIHGVCRIYRVPSHKSVPSTGVGQFFRPLIQYPATIDCGSSKDDLVLLVKSPVPDFVPSVSERAQLMSPPASRGELRQCILPKLKLAWPDVLKAEQIF